MPGSVESMAVSSVQSMKAPFGSNSRCVGNTCARTAALTPGRSSAPNSPGPGVNRPAGALACSHPPPALGMPLWAEKTDA